MVKVYFYNYLKYENEPEDDPYRGLCFYTHNKDRVKETKKIVSELLKNDSNYIRVADVHTDSLDMAFMLTNNVDHSWHMNLGVDIHHHYGRSSMVGDIFELDGKKFIVMSTGFEEVE